MRKPEMFDIILYVAIAGIVISLFMFTISNLKGES